ncbi:hypothetical protein BT96DRAFT_937962 [Gymnopus androsaceus JB14]|uniref:Uncharacterized protein n=1 Tax=Gymnopus androsaceus JB14 TaxID=1447944 RepID=A0A6A4HU04_9AGAR|nr:hypothetical protein BT96DRAFT_937962 [Gymnopus androsaceus JB14]
MSYVRFEVRGSGGLANISVGRLDFLGVLANKEGFYKYTEEQQKQILLHTRTNGIGLLHLKDKVKISVPRIYTAICKDILHSCAPNAVFTSSFSVRDIPSASHLILSAAKHTRTLVLYGINSCLCSNPIRRAKLKDLIKPSSKPSKPSEPPGAWVQPTFTCLQKLKENLQAAREHSQTLVSIHVFLLDVQKVLYDAKKLKAVKDEGRSVAENLGQITGEIAEASLALGQSQLHALIEETRSDLQKHKVSCENFEF